MIRIKQIVPGKQREVSALFGALCFCFTELYQIKHKLYVALLGLFVWSPNNEYMVQVVQ